jgi:hypothetical protein
VTGNCRTAVMNVLQNEKPDRRVGLRARTFERG